jgi:signal transduction histidine kinase
MFSAYQARQVAEWLTSLTDESPADRRKNIIMLQWLATIATSYFSLFSGGSIHDDPLVLALVGGLMLTAFVLQKLPQSIVLSTHFNSLLIVGNIFFILLAIGLNRDPPWDLFLLFFLCLYIAGVGETVLKAILGCLLFTVVFTFMTFSAQEKLWLDSDTLVRIPFLFGVSMLYAYLAHQAKSEKRRADQAEQAQIVRRRLVSGLAHDIKSPLSVIKGFAEVIGLNVTNVPGQEYSLKAAQRIQENVDRILRLITGFLEASKAEGGESQPMDTPVAINSIISEVARQQTVDLQGNDLTVELKLDPDLPEILGDAAQLERVFWNLMSNAIKFTEANGKIAVTTESVRDHICARISDTGIGIPKDELPLLFSEFSRLKGAGMTEGSGLGLYIVKNIVKGHGGTVDVESVLGAGTTFILRFPVAGKAVKVHAEQRQAVQQLD